MLALTVFASMPREQTLGRVVFRAVFFLFASTKNAVASRWLATAFFRLIPESFKYADYAGNQFYLIVGHPIACKGA